MLAWLVAILSGPLLGWMIGSSIGPLWTASSWHWRTIAWLVLGAALPWLAALWHGIANVRRKAPVLPIVVLTALASAFTYRGWVHLAEGPKTESVVIRQIQCKQHSGKRVSGWCVVSALVLADSRTLLANPATTRGIDVPSTRTIMTIDDVAIDVR